MSGRRVAIAAVTCGVLLTAGGCPAAGQGSADRPAAAPRAQPATDPPLMTRGPDRVLGTEATTDLPAYTGPPPGGPPTAGPATTLRASVDLTPATPGVFSVPEAAVGTPDGRVHLVLDPVDPQRPETLATVGPAEGDVAVTASVPLPGLAEPWAMHLLPDGGVVISGRFEPAVGGGGVGFGVVDPLTGALRTTVVAPLPDGGRPVFGLSALARDGRTLILFVTVGEHPVYPQELLAADVATGQVLARRDLAGDVAGVSLFPAGPEVAGLVPRPGGGATLVFDASPTAIRPARIPTLLNYDAALLPDGVPVRLTDLTEEAETQAVTTAADGTLFLVVEVREGAWILAVPDGGGAGPVLAVVDDPSHDYALTVDPAQAWALLPDLAGVRAFDLATGEDARRLDLGCHEGLYVRDIVPSGDGAGALLIGECGRPSVRTQMLWITGP